MPETVDVEGPPCTCGSTIYRLSIVDDPPALVLDDDGVMVEAGPSGQHPESVCASCGKAPA